MVRQPAHRPNRTGISQDIVAFLSRRKGKPLPKHLAFPRAICLGIVVGLLVIGWTLGFKLLDPYSNFGRAFASYGIGAILPFVIVLALSVWRDGSNDALTVAFGGSEKAKRSKSRSLFILIS